MYADINQDKISLIVMLVLGIIAMPIIGLFMLFGKSEQQKAIGFLLLVFGLILWLVMATQG